MSLMQVDIVCSHFVYSLHVGNLEIQSCMCKITSSNAYFTDVLDALNVSLQLLHINSDKVVP